MPQLQLLPHGPSEMQDLRLLLRPPNKDRDALEVIVSVQRPGQVQPSPVWVGTLPGLEADLLETFVQAVVNAWAFGEDARAVSQACAKVKHEARKHRRAHEF